MTDREPSRCPYTANCYRVEPHAAFRAADADPTAEIPRTVETRQCVLDKRHTGPHLIELPNGRQLAMPPGGHNA